MEKTLELPIDNEERLTAIIDLVFEKVGMMNTNRPVNIANQIRVYDAWCPDQSALSIHAREPIPIVQWLRHLPGVRDVPRSTPSAGKVRIFR